MKQRYDVTYKPFLNERINAVQLGNKQTHPLYIQLTYQRKSIQFKSYYFGLFSQPKYMSLYPDIEQIVEKESVLIEHIILKHEYDFSLELFLREYKYYSPDLLEIIDKQFKDYLYIFFNDEGLPTLAYLIQEAREKILSSDLLLDFRTSLKPSLLEKLHENAAKFASPYLPFYSFLKTPNAGGLITLSLFQWEDSDLQARFATFLEKSFPDYQLSAIESYMTRVIKHLRSQ